jgi:ABC-type branched-subunit amino acid transport system substrate-binding protein
MKRSSKMPRDPNQRAFKVVQMSVGEEPEEEKPKKDAVSQYLSEIGRKGGLKGGKARKESLTPEQRKEIARKAAKARWGNKK